VTEIFEFVNLWGIPGEGSSEKQSTGLFFSLSCAFQKKRRFRSLRTVRKGVAPPPLTLLSALQTFPLLGELPFKKGWRKLLIFA
ncbi:MAG: hypothetical protein J1F37_07840, partial [Oscillospiraceae bacterium]|nr:hypothetical protein [Oscillospiraceae bacterium]